MMGAPPEVIDEYLAKSKKQDDEFHVHEDAWDTFELFAQLGTQWRVQYGAMGGRVVLGLDYQAVHALMQIKCIPRSKQDAVFSDIRIMELAALEVMNTQKE